jgi:hypothetical protein
MFVLLGAEMTFEQARFFLGTILPFLAAELMCPETG